MKKETYKLFALIFHSEEGQSDDNKGHYYINVMDWFSGHWFKCNDEYIDQMKPSKRLDDEDLLKRWLFLTLV